MIRKLIISIIILLFPVIIFATEHNKREMRAVWVTTLLNLDWPSAPGLSEEIQKEEFIKMLDAFQKSNINTVIVQIRPSGDAIYPSKYANWSKWLTGKQGLAPENNFDPLAFIVEETHKRCMEIHAWINPFRIVFNYESDPAEKFHISNTKPEWVVSSGKHKYLNPGIPEVREYINDIVSEIVTNYDIDAVHFDDYFYPQLGKNETFNDKAEFEKYGSKFKNLLDWRRDNVNTFIKEIGENIHKIKSYVKFGISPFPVWRNKSQDSLIGVNLKASSSYDDLCADVLLWARQGWIDYVMPQLYGNIGHKYLDYAVLVNWWNEHCSNINIYTGQAIYKLDSNSSTQQWKSSKEILDQLALNNKYEFVKGHAFFRAKFFTDNPLNITNSLGKSFHKYPSIVPINKQIPEIRPEKLNFVFLKESKTSNTLSWTSSSINNKYYIIYRYKGIFPNYSAENIYKITKEHKIDIPEKDFKEGYKYCVSSLSRTNHESAPTKAYIVKS